MAFWSLKKKKQTKPEKPEKQIKGPWNYQPPASFSPDKPSGPSSERIPLPFTGLEKQELNLYPKKQQSPAPPPEKKADPQPSNQDILEQIADLYLKGDTATIFRLILGEVMFAQSLGYKKYQICTADDENTCPRCRKMDGKVFLLSEAQLGVNLPPFCDFCRCSIIVIDPSGE